MKIFEVEQGSYEWLELRLGIPTASEFNKIFSPVQLKKSTQQKDYMYELIAERILKRPLDDISSVWLDRGRAEENRAIKAYEFMNDVVVKKVGFIKNDDQNVGASPDGVVGEKGGVEVKVPNAKNYLRIVAEENYNKYKTQMQCCMWISEREWWDLVIHNEAFGSHVKRFERDDDFIKKMEEHLNEFIEKVNNQEQLVRNQINIK